MKKMLLPADPAARKGMPITSGVLDYFPLAIAEVAIVSKAGNDQHNPGQPLHWARDKSTDHADCIPRHLIDRGTRDSDGMRHSAKLAWRALALLQTELEEEAKQKVSDPAAGVVAKPGTLAEYIRQKELAQPDRSWIAAQQQNLRIAAQQQNLRLPGEGSGFPD